MPFELTSEAHDLLAWNISNEVVNGFRVEPFSERIGVSVDDFKSIALRLRSQTASSQLLLTDQETQIYCNALGIVIEELGDDEFQTRTGHEYEYGLFLLQQLSQSLPSNRS